jgi:hypothetical protein
LVEAAQGSLAEPGETRRYEPDPDFEEAEHRQRNAYSPRRASAARARKQSNPLIGTRVRHPTYGVGTILQVENEGDDRRFTVSFLDHGTKKLIERYAHLEVVS